MKNEEEYQLCLEIGESNPLQFKAQAEECTWTVKVKGCHLKKRTLERVWAKLRKHCLRPKGVDCVALFYVNQELEKIVFIPECSIFERESNEVEFISYLKKVAPALSETIVIFTKIITEAQKLQDEGLECDEIIERVFNRETLHALIVSDLTPKEQTRYFRSLHKDAKREHKAALKELKAAQKIVSFARGEYDHYLEVLENLDGRDKDSALVAVRKAENYLHRTEELLSEKEAVAKNTEAYLDKVRKFIAESNDGPFVPLKLPSFDPSGIPEKMLVEIEAELSGEPSPSV